MASVSAGVLLWRNVFKPLQQLSKSMTTISAASNLSLRVPEANPSLVSSLIESVNLILDTTESSYMDMLNARCNAENLNQGKSMFIAKVSHELRTPIHGITGMLRILLKQEHVAGKRQYIQMAQDSAHALLGTINELLDFSKMQSGDLSLEHKPFRLAETVRGTVEQLIARFEEKPEVQLCWDIHPGVPEFVVGDAARIKNILLNLLGNSFKFTEQGSVILELCPREAVEVSGEPGVRLTVRDTGIGIPAEKLCNIFNPFTTAHERAARLYPGTGLGLAIVKQIVECMGGSINVESVEGEGTCFTVDLPLSKAEEAFVSCTADVGVPKRVAVFGRATQRRTVIAGGLARFGCAVDIFDSESPTELRALHQIVASYDLIHIIKDEDVLLDEFRPLFAETARTQTAVVLSLPSADLASTRQLHYSDCFFVTVQPTCALDVLLMASGRLAPTTSIHAYEEQQEHVRHKLRILVADDAKTNRIILKNLLEEAGHSVELVENGQQVLDLIAAGGKSGPVDAARFDLILTDVQMPVMDGITAAQNVRELERQGDSNRKLPIIAVTSYALPEECSRMLASGIDHVITKPISPRRLSRLLSQISCEVDMRGTQAGEGQTHHELVEELCRIAHGVAERVSDITQQALNMGPPSGEVEIDVQDIYERSGNSLRRTGLIMNGFLESYAEPLRTLRSTALPLADTTTFRRAVHSLKGLLLDVGADPAATMASRLEEIVVNAPDEVTLESIAELYGATTRSVLILQELVGALPSVQMLAALPPIEGDMCFH
jgi:signal transduction histidine kinase/CheY-like chemotaxis protein